MARSRSPFPVSGKLDDVQFTVRNGKNFVHMAPSYRYRHQRCMASPRHDRYKLNLREFAIASRMGCLLYKQLVIKNHTNPANPGPIFRPYSQNILTGRIKKAAANEKKHAERAQGKHWFADEIRTPDIALALRGLDLGRGESVSRQVVITTFGPSHNPTELKITGLPDAAKAITTAAGHRIECRIRIHQAGFNEQVWNPKLKQWQETPNLRPDGKVTTQPQRHAPSDWIPVEIIPEDGIRIPIPQCDEGSKHITAVIIEWREHRGFGRRIVRLHDHGIVRIAAVHAPASAFKQAIDVTHVPHTQHLIPATLARLAPEPAWRTHPKEYLDKVLAPIRPKEPAPPEPIPQLE
ncbi:MAG: hypothetical protein U0176_20315 [Bacteroidia bacterium]